MIGSCLWGSHKYTFTVSRSIVNSQANIVRLPLIGLSSLLGGYYGGQTVAPSCLKSIMLQDTPLAGEAMAILEQLAPDSSMLRRAREAHQTSSGSLEAVALPRVAAAAAQQRAQSSKNLPTKDVSSANKEDAWSDTNSALDLHINWGDNDAEGEPQAPRRQPRRSVHEQMIAEKAAAARAARANGEEITFERRRRNQYGDTWDTA